VAVFNFSPGDFNRNRRVASSDIVDVAFSNDGKSLASAGEDGGVRLWNLTNRQEAPEVPLPRGEVSIGLASDGQGWLVASWIDSDSAGKLYLRRYTASKPALLWEKSLRRPVCRFSNGNALAVSLGSMRNNRPSKWWRSVRKDRRQWTVRAHRAQPGRQRRSLAADQNRFISSASTGDRASRPGPGHRSSTLESARTGSGWRWLAKTPTAVGGPLSVQNRRQGSRRPLRVHVLNDLAPRTAGYRTASKTAIRRAMGR
jgi:hypothetical protein